MLEQFDDAERCESDRRKSPDASAMSVNEVAIRRTTHVVGRPELQRLRHGAALFPLHRCRASPSFEALVRRTLGGCADTGDVCMRIER